MNDRALVRPTMATKNVRRVPPGITESCGTMPAAQIFINYRTEDEPFGAALIDHALSALFGESRIFRASKSIRPGDDFVDALINGLRRSSVLLVVIGPRWSIGPASRCWAADSVDWVRYEIAEAFRQGIRVIPVLLNVDPPSEAHLPPDVAPLAHCQYVRIRHRHSRHDLEYLARELTTLVPVLRTNRSVRRYRRAPR
jgi:TIR domain